MKSNQNTSTVEQPNEKKANAFGFIGKSTVPEQAQPKKDAFNFIKGGQTQNAGTTQSNTGTSQNMTTTPNILGLYTSGGNQQPNQMGGGLSSINFNMNQPVQQQQQGRVFERIQQSAVWRRILTSNMAADTIISSMELECTIRMLEDHLILTKEGSIWMILLKIIKG